MKRLKLGDVIKADWRIGELIEMIGTVWPVWLNG